MTSQLITVKPSVENCDPLARYQTSTPGEFAFQELPILYGGGRKWILEAKDSQALKYIALAHQKLTEVDVFALNTSLIIWLNDYNKGIEIAYPIIDAHAVTKQKQGKLQLYLQVRNVGVFENIPDQFQETYGSSFTELILTPLYSKEDRHYNDTIERLFTFADFGINRGDTMVVNTFNAIRKCSAFHYVESDVDDDNVMGSDPNYYEDGYDNSGNADDIGNYTVQDEMSFKAGIDVKVFSEVRGKTRSREELSFEESSQERNESPKRVKC